LDITAKNGSSFWHKQGKKIIAEQQDLLLNHGYDIN
jgi:hypothetical protein